MRLVVLCFWSFYLIDNDRLVVRVAMPWSMWVQQLTERSCLSTKSVFVNSVLGYKLMVKLSMPVYRGNIKRIKPIPIFGKIDLRECWYFLCSFLQVHFIQWWQMGLWQSSCLAKKCHFLHFRFPDQLSKYSDNLTGFQYWPNSLARR